MISTRLIAFLLALMLLALCRCTPAANTSGEVAAADLPVPELTNLDGRLLAEIKAGGGAQVERWAPAYARLIGRADSLLDAPLYAVTQKTGVPPSGDKHDYLSLAPYWWPDPEKEDGLPWIRRDGERNPRTAGLDVDVTARRNAFGNFYHLSLAAYLSDRQAYADRARQQLRTWFLDPETRMHPHLEYAQGIPGRNDGRCYGIIEFRAITEVITGVELLGFLGELTDAEREGFTSWISDYTDWLVSSELGREEGSRHNNHGTWYDVQLVSMLRYLDRQEEAGAVLERAKTDRIAAHLAADGSQPEEIARTKSLSYSTMNLEGLTILAYHGKRMGIDLWNYQDEEGVGLPDAYAYLRPYALGEREWTYPQLGDLAEVRRELRGQFLRAGSQMDEPDYCSEAMRGARSDSSLQRLLYPCPGAR
ncbi:alginate lyase family protein [Lewinella sp. IMCC34191]|uniref:alginate lyase family protein n=1 Tax=Lewinella sp. IMCC34191 TaxID=2259172 RepID=UPI000E23059B|nr:alginate lyase family protein [Lewinella sp. IMCC34191]